jgi:transposase
VSTKSGEGQLVLPRCDTEALNLPLAEIAKHVAQGAHAVLILDQAGWHLSGRLAVPDNITIVPLPLKCPEFNPRENIWQFMRDNWLSNRIFKSCEDILDHCCYAWNKLIEQRRKIMSIGTREWLSGSSQYELV